MINTPVRRIQPVSKNSEVTEKNEGKSNEFWLNKKVFARSEYDEFRNLLFLSSWPEAQKIIARRMDYLMDNNEMPKQFSSQENDMHVIRGFISPDYRITYHYPYFYRVLSTDYIYQAVEDYREYSKNVRYKFGPVTFIGWFLNDYLGWRKKISERDEIFLEEAKQIFDEAKKNGEDPTKKMEQIDIEFLRKNHVCFCSEGSVYAQNILSFFGLDSYICLGNIEITGYKTGETSEKAHCFNLFGGSQIVDFSFFDDYVFNNRRSRSVATKDIISSRDEFLRGVKSEELTLYSYDLSNAADERKPKQRIVYRVLPE